MKKTLAAICLLAAGLIVAVSVRPRAVDAPVPRRPQKIVSLTLGSSEILIDLVPPERIAALHRIAADSPHSNIRERARGFRLVGSDVEEIAAVQPDLVIVASYSGREFVEQLRRARLPLFTVTEFDDVDSICRSIEALGTAAGEPERAKEMVARMRSTIETLQRKIPQNRPPMRVMSLAQSGTTAGKRTTFDSLIRLAGARNVAAEQGIDKFGAISAEQVVAWDPDVIVVGKDPDTGQSLKMRLLTDRAYATLRNKRIIEVPYPHFTCVSQYIVERLRDLVEGLYE